MLIDPDGREIKNTQSLTDKPVGEGVVLKNNNINEQPFKSESIMTHIDIPEVKVTSERSQTNASSKGAYDFISDPNSFYNSELGRWIFPDAIAVAGEATVAWEVGVKTEPYIDITILRGPKFGQSKRYWSLAVGAGLDISVAASGTTLKYFGAIKDINFKTFEGPYGELNIGASYIVDAGMSFSYSPDFSGKSRGVIGLGSSLGFGFSPLILGGSFMVGNTKMYKD